MTFAIYIVLIIGLFIAFLNILPVASALSFTLAPAIETIVGYMRAWDFMFPIHELFVFLTIFIGLEITLWGIRQGSRVIRFLRGHTDGA